MFMKASYSLFCLITLFNSEPYHRLTRLHSSYIRRIVYWLMPKWEWYDWTNWNCYSTFCHSNIC